MAERFSPKPKEAVKQLAVKAPEVDILAEANAIANKAFGNDFERASKTLDFYERHAATCGCGQCRRDLEQVQAEIFGQWRRPPEIDEVKTTPQKMDVPSDLSDLLTDYQE